MQVPTSKTWSQRSLALGLPPVGAQDSGFLTVEKRQMLLLALKTALAAGLCYWLATLVGLQDGYWGSISAIIVLQSNVGSTVTASRDRLIGTLIGAGFGAIFSFLGTGIWPYAAAVITAMVTCSLLGLKNSARLAGVTVTILMLVHRVAGGPGSKWENWVLPLHRVLEVLFGIVVALTISALVFPSRAKARLRDGLAQEFLLMGALFEAVLAGFRGEAPGNLAEVRKSVAETVATNQSLLEAARNEPSGGPASLEGLSLVHQFGRELEDLLHALELAVQGSSGDAYAAHLEPELGKLVADIHRGFQYVAGCIHRWEFSVAPKGLYLENDITELKAKVEKIRPTGLEFPQSEILRAYAVQLHLKQMARMLRATRVESAKTVVSG